ncbi:MAG: fluoride efflux transporter CrcB [Caulobacteraceae bacterium]
MTAKRQTATRRPLAAEAALYAVVSLGGACGAVLRWTVSLAFNDAAASWPWATFIANGTGSFLIGFIAHVTGPDGRVLVSPRLRHFVMTGVLGGYTTFSIFSLETMQLAVRGAIVMAAAYVAASLTTWLAAVWLGDALARQYNKLRRARS